MAKTDRLSELSVQLVNDISSFASSHEATQGGLVREHLEPAHRYGVVAAPLCQAVCGALGLGGEESRQLAVIVGLVECAALALEGVRSGASSVEARHGQPLALNSSDALYALAHIALAEYEASEGGRRGLSLRLDRLCLRLWEKVVTAEEASPEIARIAGEVAGVIAGRGEAAIIALGDFAAAAASDLKAGTTGVDATRALERASLSERERSLLAALVD